jgi:hypothetical protein
MIGTHHQLVGIRMEQLQREADEVRLARIAEKHPDQKPPQGGTRTAWAVRGSLKALAPRL